jgi:hypothetical protein
MVSIEQSRLRSNDHVLTRRDSLHTLRLASLAKQWRQRLHESVLVRLWYALRLEGRSFAGRMRTLLSIKHWGVDLGPLWEAVPSERQFDLNRRTNARSQGTRNLIGDYPWASSVDLQIFLRGFDVGERYALRSTGTPEPERRAS